MAIQTDPIGIGIVMCFVYVDVISDYLVDRGSLNLFSKILLHNKMYSFVTSMLYYDR